MILTEPPYTGTDDDIKDCPSCGVRAYTYEQYQDEWGAEAGWSCTECGYTPEASEAPPAPHDARGLAAQIIGCEEDIERIDRAVYKGTSCGAWVRQIDFSTLHIGSIVEGVEAEVTPVEVTAPFTAEEFWNAVQQVEDRATEIWNDTHGCDQCPVNPECPDFHVINPECPACHGQGVIL